MEIAYKYWTKSKGVGGKVLQPEDFVVNEIIGKKFLRAFERTVRGVKRVEGPYSLFLLKKKNMTTHKAIKIVSQRLGVPVGDIGYAGLKDKFAVTSQYVTIKGTDKEGPALNNLSLEKVGVTNGNISAGDLECNEFIITLHNCRHSDLSRIEKELQRGVPNYFGPQRFGTNRNNPVIGKLLVKKHFAKALNEIRHVYGKNYSSLSVISKNALKFFVNAYQSWIFNETLNGYIAKSKKPLFQKIPLVGFDTRLGNNAIGNIIKPILLKEKIKPADFQISELNMACRGGARDAFIKVKIEIDSSREKDKTIILHFMLPKGSYATNVIREICKNED